MSASLGFRGALIADRIGNWLYSLLRMQLISGCAPAPDPAVVVHISLLPHSKYALLRSEPGLAERRCALANTQVELSDQDHPARHVIRE